MKPLVSICCITYNHELYIREAIEGFLMQKTTFAIEILLHDDASTDGTAEVIREYEKKYPNLIFPVYQTENQYSKGVKISFTYQFPRARGKYIALCEGDDYWTDPLKLQKQMDFLEKNPEYVLCGHNSKIIFDYDKEKILFRWPDFVDHPKETLHTADLLNSLIRHDYLPYHTSSVAFRNVFKSHGFTLPVYNKPIISGDIFLFILLSIYGPSKIIDEVMSVRRKNKGGVTYLYSREHVLKNWIFTMNKLRAQFGLGYQILFARLILKYFKMLCRIKYQIIYNQYFTKA